MKKLLLLTATTLISLTSFGQEKKKELGGWYLYINESIDSGINLKEIKYVTLFPDSNVLSYNTSDSAKQYLGNCNLHSVGQVFDPKYKYFSDPEPLRWCHTYTVDSVSIYYQYNHVGDSSIDTLKIQFYQNAQVRTVNFSGGGSSYSVQYDYMSNLSTSHNFSREINLLLDSSDDTKGKFIWKSIAVPGGGMSVNSNNISAFTITFRPSFSHDSGDTIEHLFNPIKKLNQFKPLLVVDTNKTVDTSANIGLFISTTQRYNLTGNGWQSLNIPGDVYQNHNRYLKSGFHVTSVRGCTGNVPDVQSLNNINLYPNPISNSQELTVEFELDKQQELSFTITDITGRLLKQVDANNYQQGENKLTVSLDGLASGMYYLNVINNDGQRSTKPIVIN